MTYRAAVRYLESLVNYEKIPRWQYRRSLNLRRFRNFLSLIGNPQQQLKCIHIAGSKGKGSTCAFIAYILREAGFKVGLYTSPHLCDFRERIRILSRKSLAVSRKLDFEGMIARQGLADLVSCLRPQVARFNRVFRYGSLTFFEACTALAFLYFREEKVDFAVLETGLGGRLDATNAVDALVSVITPISYEHTDKLGKTLAKIAAEKSGIIKFPSPISHIPYPLTVISAPQTKEALAVIRQRCRETGARLFVSGAKPGKLKTRLLGRHQLINAAVAVAAVRALRRHNIKVSASAIRRGLLHSKWPGRCEVVARRPLVILDGAQNAASAQALARAIKENFHYQRLILVLGISSDKDIAGICRQLCPLADLIVLTRANHPRAANIAVIEKAIRYTLYAIRYKIIKSGSVREARQKAKQVAGPQDLILVTGSLFLCGEYRRLQKNE